MAHAIANMGATAITIDDSITFGYIAECEYKGRVFAGSGSTKREALICLHGAMSVATAMLGPLEAVREAAPLPSVGP